MVALVGVMGKMGFTLKPHNSVSFCVSGTYPSPNLSFPGILLEVFRKEMQCRLGAWQGRASGSCQGGVSVAPKANAMRGMLGPAKMASVGCERDSAQGHWQLFSSLLPEATQLILSLCDSSILWAAIPSPEPGWVPAREILCTSLWRGPLGFQQAPISPWRMESPPVFTARCYGGSSSWHWCSGLLSPAWGWDPPLLFFCKFLVIRFLFS